MVKLDRTIDTCHAVQTSCRDVFKSSSVNCSEIDEGVWACGQKTTSGICKIQRKKWLLIIITYYDYSDCHTIKENNRHIITPPPLEWTADAPVWIHAFIMFTLSMLQRNWDSSNEAIIKSSILWSWWACAIHSLSFLFIGDRSGASTFFLKVWCVVCSVILFCLSWL